MERTHLVVIHGNNAIRPVYDPQRYHYRWNGDFTAYVATPLRWYDTASYAKHQARDAKE